MLWPLSGIDAAQSMVEAAKEKYSDIHFSVKDVLKCCYSLDEKSAEGYPILL